MRFSEVCVRVIPCLDVREGRVVKGVQFQKLRDIGEPASMAERYETEGADEIVVLDIAATPETRSHGVQVLEAIRRRLSIPLTVGGGVRSVADAGALLDAGADRVAINSAAVRRPGLIDEIASRFGRQCAVLAIDARSQNGVPEVVIDGGGRGTGRDAVAWAREGQERGAGEILLTSHDRDGTGRGYDLPLLERVQEATGLPLVASGGAGSLSHLPEAVGAGASGVLLATLLHDGQVTVGDVKEALKSQGVRVRP